MIEYSVLDLNTYKRRAHLNYFMTMNQPQFHVTAEVDVTDLKQFCKEQNCSFFLAFLHVVALSANSIPQFRQRIHRCQDDQFQVWEYAESPTSHTEPIGGDLYGYCALHHHMTWNEYIKKAEDIQKTVREKGSLDEDAEIEAFLFVSCVPWIHYCEVIHPMIDKFDSNPKFSWGKFERNFEGKLLMPLTVAAHHGLVDGIQVARFYDNIQQNMKLLVEGKL